MNGLHSARSRRRLISRGHKKLFVAVKLRPRDLVCRYTAEKDSGYSGYYAEDVVCRYSRYTAEIVRGVDTVDIILQMWCVDTVDIHCRGCV